MENISSLKIQTAMEDIVTVAILYYFASSINGNKLILRDSGWLAGKSITITKLTKTELHITATDENSEENYEMIKR